MFATELIDFMMKLISNPEFLIICSIVKNSVIDILLLEFIDNFNLIEIDQSSIRCSTGNIDHNISLNAHFHFDEFFIHGDSKMKARLA